MEIIKNIKSIKSYSRSCNESGYKIGLVPTMGALHEGHLSLIRNIKSHVDKVIVSIFVNPMQFSPNEDFKIYPRTEDSDLNKCNDEKVDVVYMPSVESMYPSDFSTTISIGPLGRELCGASRVNYFDGIMLVIIKLIMQILPNVIIFGEKDYQMLFLIRKLLRDLDIDLKVLQAPIVRDIDGLALSSRNTYLTSDQRAKANYLYNTLIEIASELKQNPNQMSAIIEEKKNYLNKNGFNVDYLEIRDNNNLQNLSSLKLPARIFAAAYLGKCRLIDNMLIS